MSELPLAGDRPAVTVLDPEPPEAVDRLKAALDGGAGGLGERLRRVAAAFPALLDAWARLAERAREEGDHVTAYAYARTGYHRGLDRARKAGWRGQGPVPWEHEANRGFLRSVHELMLAAGAVGEMDEAARCQAFLLELDPEDTFGVADLDVDDLRR